MKENSNITEKIQSHIDSDYDYVESLGYTVLGVFLQGSQNYGLAYENSDIDTKCIVIPTFEDFCNNRKPISTTLILPSGEHIDLKDIRLMFECFKKQNLNFLEILFTKYRKINPLFEELYMPILQNAEHIARYNNHAFVNCMVHMSDRAYKALEHPCSTRMELFEKYGYDPKELHLILRLNEFLIRYIDGVAFKDCLCSEKADYIISVKKGYYTFEEAEKVAKAIKADTDYRQNQYMTSVPLFIDDEVENILKTVLQDILKESLTLIQ